MSKLGRSGAKVAAGAAAAREVLQPFVANHPALVARDLSSK